MSKPKLVTALYPDLVWHEETFTPDLGILMSEEGIIKLVPQEQLRSEVEKERNSGGTYIVSRRLPGRAVIPGFVNTHSHAFQRAIRGRTEFPAAGAKGQEQDFWSWRGLMYQAASELSPPDIEAVAQAVFVEMVKSGITRVGEFHYLHHQPDGTPYPDPDELARRVLSGARSAGIEVTLLRAFYQRAGVDRPTPQGAQRIFCDPSVEFYLETLDRLREEGVAIGVTAHSVRAVARDELQKLVEYSQRESLPFHIHASEQQKEIQESLQEYGVRPVQLLKELGALGERTTVVHAIHLDSTEIEALGEGRCFIASCPTTERNLGDGIVPAAALLERGARFTFGTDSQCQISLPEDARQLEYHLRLQEQRRSILFDGRDSAGVRMLGMLTKNGAESLGAVHEGRLEVGAASNLIALDLDHLALAGWSRDSLALDVVFSFTPDMVTDVWIRGAEVVSEGYHRAEEQARANLRRVIKKLRRQTAGV